MVGPDDDALDPRLAAFFAADEPPARDPVFEGQVAQRLDVRRLLSALMDVVPWVAAAIGLTWALWPAVFATLSAVFGFLGVWGPLGLATALVGATVWAGWRYGLFDFLEDAI